MPLRRRAPLISVLVFLTACTGGPGQSPTAKMSTPRPSSSTSPGTIEALPASQVSLFQSSLTATDPRTVERCLAPQVRAAYAHKPFRLLPAGSTLSIDGTRFTVSGDVGTVPAVVTDGPTSEQWLLLLARVNGTWLVYGTRKA